MSLSLWRLRANRAVLFPAWMIPWRQTWLYGSALLVLVASAGLCFSRTALASALTICAYQTVWAVICALPVLSQPLSVGAWYGFCEALAPLVGAWILYATLRWQSAGLQPIAGERVTRVAQILFGLTCVFYGWSHFAYADYTASMVPAWLPGRLGIAYFTGLGHVAAGIGIVVWILPRLAATLEAIMMSSFRSSGLGAELICASPTRLGGVAAKSMVRTRGELGVGRRRVARRDFLEKPSSGACTRVHGGLEWTLALRRSSRQVSAIGRYEGRDPVRFEFSNESNVRNDAMLIKELEMLTRWPLFRRAQPPARAWDIAGWWESRRSRPIQQY